MEQIQTRQLSVALTILLDALKESEALQTSLEIWAKIYKIIDGVKKVFHGTEVLEELSVFGYLIASLRRGVGDQVKEIRVTCYRTLRSMISEATLKSLVGCHFDLFIIRSLVRDSRSDSEREAAIRFIRAWLDHEMGPSIIPISIIRVLVALAEQADDKFRHIAAETIAEFAIRKPEMAAHANAYRALFTYMTDGPKEMLEPMVSTILFLLDTHETRKYLRPQVELETVISHFIDAYTVKGAFTPEKLHISATVIKTILSSWIGLMTFCLDDFAAIRAIVETMTLPNDEIRIEMLRLIYDIFRIPYDNGGSPLTSKSTSKAPRVESFNLATQYYAFLLMIFIDAGLIDALVETIQSKNQDISDSSVCLLSALLRKCTTQLPDSYSNRVQSLTSLFKLASDFQNEGMRHFAVAKLTDILDRHLDIHPSPNVLLSLSNESLNRDISEHASIKTIIGSRLDDNQFRSMLADSEVLDGKDVSKWNWEVILDLVETQLGNRSRFEELAKNCKFVTRLLGFYRPLNRQFSGFPRHGSMVKVVKVGCELIKALGASAEGQRILLESRLFAEIEECLTQIVSPGLGGADMLFTKDRMESSLTCEYFRFIGILASTADGIRILDQMRIFSLYYQLIDLRGRDDIIKTMITSMDYSLPGHSRIILSKSLTSGYKHIRMFGTNYLEHLFDKQTPDFHSWAIPLLAQQLYDPNFEICDRAITILHRICTVDRQCLDTLIRARPLVSQLSEIGNLLLLDCLSTAEGFLYCLESGYIDSELEYWFETGIFQYVTQIELSMIEGLSGAPPLPPRNKKERESATHLGLNLNGRLPLHFYGELGKTFQGCDYLIHTYHIPGFLEVLNQYRTVEMTEKGVFKLKALVWTICSIGSSQTGLQFLNKYKVAPILLEISKLSLTLSLRGTALFGISLLGQSTLGRELLEEYGWSFDGSLCLPSKMMDYVTLPSWQFDGSWPLYQTQSFKPLHYAMDSIEDEILKCLGNLSNHILATAASKRLAILRQQHPFHFARPEICVNAWRIATLYHYRIPTRRFIQELFDRVVFDDAALEILDLMDGLQMGYSVDEKEVAKLNENTLKSSLALLPKEDSVSVNTKNRLSLVPNKVIRGF